MTISNFNDLRAWFAFGFDKGVKTAEEGRENNSPYWTLYSVGLGGRDTVLAFNDRLTSLDDSYTALVESIRRMNNPQGSMFRVFQTYKPRHNVATQEARVQVFENNQLAQQSNQPPSIGGLVGYVEKSEMHSIIAAEREKWETQQRIKDLENQIESPGDWTEKLINGIDRIGQTPIGAMLMAKLMGVNPQQFSPAPINGPQGAHTQDLEEDSDEDLEGELDALQAIANANGLTLKQFLSKTASVAKAQPGAVSMLVNS